LEKQQHAARRRDTSAISEAWGWRLGGLELLGASATDEATDTPAVRLRQSSKFHRRRRELQLYACIERPRDNSSEQRRLIP
jgi:hypothetical protein